MNDRRVIELRRAEALHPGDWILAQYDGVLGPWRITETRYEPSIETHAGGSMLLTLVPASYQAHPTMLQQHHEHSLVPMLVPLPEPIEAEPVTEQQHYCNARIEIIVHPERDPNACQCTPCRRERGEA